MKPSSSIVAASLVLAGATAAGAQQFPLRVTPGTTPAVQRATSAPERVRPEPAFPNPPVGPLFPVGVTHVPVVVMSDGSAWANFGNGFVPVRYGCRVPRAIDSRGFSTTQRRDRAPAC